MICSSEATRIMPAILLDASPPSPSSRLVLPVPLSPSISRRFSRYARAIGYFSSPSSRSTMCYFSARLTSAISRWKLSTQSRRYSTTVLKRALSVSSLGHVLYELGIPVGIISFFLSKEHTIEILGTIEKSRIDFKLAICVLLFYLYHNGA